jgi:hypothetical protein
MFSHLMVFFALMASLMVEIPDFSANALGIYGLTVVLGLFIMAFIFILPCY